MDEKDRSLTREEYAEIWKNIPASESAIEIPEGATEEGAAQGRVLPADISPEEGRRVLSDMSTKDTSS